MKHPDCTADRCVTSRGRLIWLLAMAGQAAWAAESTGGGAVVGRTLWETFKRGGPVMWPILVLSVVGLAIALEGLFITRRAAILPEGLREALGSKAGSPDLETLVAKAPKACISQILAAGSRWRRGTQEQIQSAIQEAVDGLLWKFRRALRPLGIIANTAPLLGLLGTVFGIIDAFDVVARQGALGDPAALADGIAEALLTTAFGLVVAIPMLLAYHYLLGRTEAMLHHCEELAREALILPPK